MTIYELLKNGKERLAQAGVQDAGIDSRRLFSFLTGMSDTDIVVRGREDAGGAAAEYQALVEKRASGVPLQYITHEQEFMGLPFYVDERVLIPRLDTEILVEEALRSIEQLAADNTKPIRVLDLCCGSGAIGISCAVLKGPDNVHVTCSDISEGALEVTRINAEKNGADIELVQGDMLEPFLAFNSEGGICRFDLILCNPPYIRSDEIPALMTEVREHEPVSALDGGPDGLEFYRRLVKDAPEALCPGGILMMEIGYDQREAVMALLEDDGRYNSTRCIKDFAGLDRVITANTVRL